MTVFFNSICFLGKSAAGAFRRLALVLPFFLILWPARGAEIPLLLHWNHQSQFAGYYVAAEKGFYRKRGRDAVIRRGGSDIDQAALLAGTNPVFCTTMLFTALACRDKGVPVIHLAQVVNRPNFCLVAWKNRGISRPEDLGGRKVSFWIGAFEAPYRDFFKRYRLAPLVEPQYYSVNLFLRGGVDACAAMYYNEYHTLLQCGVDPEDLTVFKTWEHGFDCPEDGIYCTAQTAADPAMCHDIVEASLEGWQYARDHREEALDIVMGYVRRDHVPTNRAHMQWMLDKMLDSIFPGPGDRWRFGVLERESYDRAVALLRGQAQIKSAPAFDDFHPPSFACGVTTEGRPSSSFACGVTTEGRPSPSFVCGVTTEVSGVSH